MRGGLQGFNVLLNLKHYNILTMHQFNQCKDYRPLQRIL
jgi:hypothetical protein